MGAKATLKAKWSILKPLITFTTPKSVKIVDWRLGLLYYGLTLAILIFVLWDVITKQSYLLNETPGGRVGPWATGGENLTSVQDTIYAAESTGTKHPEFKYCTGDKTYLNFQYDSDFVYNNYECAFLPEFAMSRKQSENEYFFTTSFQEEKVISTFAATEADCPASFDAPGITTSVGADGVAVPDDGTGVPYKRSYAARHCRYQKLASYVVAGPENKTLHFEHSYDTSLVGVDGKSPRTLVRRKGSEDTYYTFAKGEVLSAPVWQWIQWAGVDLDEEWDSQPNVAARETSAESPPLGQGFSNASYPRPRVSGAEINVQLSYYNFKQYPGADKALDNGPKGDVICILEFDPVMRFSSLGHAPRDVIMGPTDPYIITAAAGNTGLHYQVDTFRYGLKFRFSATGIVGKFDYGAFISALVAGAVLIGVAETLCTYVALYALGLESQLYTEFIKEEVNYKEEYARYATQAIVAAETFFRHDTSGDRLLSSDEIKMILEKVFADRMTDSQLNAMTKYLMQNAQMGAKDEDYEEDDVPETLNLVEWVNVFTSGKTNLRAFKRIIGEMDSLEPNPAANGKGGEQI